MALASSEAEGPPEAVHGVDTPAEPAAGKPVTGTYSPALYFESKQRILDLLRLFSEHGYVSSDDIAGALDRSSELVFPRDLVALRRRVQDLEEKLRWERLANEMTRWEREDAELELGSQRELVRESLVHIASLEARLKDARRTTLKLIAASRNSLSTLKRVRDHLAAQTYAVGALTPLVHDFQELTQVVQELHSLSIVRAASAPLHPEMR